MKNRILLFGLVLITFSTMMFTSCKGKKGGTGGTVIIREMGDPDKLNVLTSSSANARIINALIFSQINGGEPFGDFNIVPILCKENAKISEINDGEWKGGMKLEFEIRDEAKWDNGTPVTGYDYVFTIKTVLNPKVNSEHLRSYYEWVGDIVVDSTNPKKFTVYSNKKYYKIEEFAGYYIIPEYNYDPTQIMRKFTVRDLNSDDKREKLKSNSDIQKFAEEFNSEKFQRDPKYITGMGPYKLESWTTGQEVVVKRKDSWWGDKFKDLRQFWAFPKKIKFRVINDQNTAITALKDGAIDAFYQIPAKEFEELVKNEKFTQKFMTEKKDFLAYSFLYLNLRNEIFKDINVRKALTHAVNRDKINETIYFNDFIKTESFVHPIQKTYNKNLEPRQFDLALSNKILDEAGWKDSDGDGIRDKVINGKKKSLVIEFKYNSGNEQRKNTALIVQEDFKKIGVQMNIVAKEWTVFLQEMDKFQYEMAYGSFTVPARISDPKQNWHTVNSVAGGGNKSGWGNSQTDKMIDDIGRELDAEKRKAIYMDLQKIMHDDYAVIYLFGVKNRLAISKKYSVETIITDPGYEVAEFKLAN